MQRPAPWQILFSLKAFAAAMLALYIALALDLPRPYWAMTTVYVVSQPFAGAIRSKGVFRICGTLLGAAAAVTIYSVFGDSEIALMAGLIGFFLFCGYFALSDRSPRSYFFLLAGLTALLIAWPASAMSSGTIFETALARVQEIGLGILCAVLVDSVFFPRRIAPAVDSEIGRWFESARTWACDILDGKSQATTLDRSRLAAEAAQIEAMLVHLDYESEDGTRRVRWLHALQRRMLMALPILSSIDDRLGELRRDGAGLPDELDRLVGSLSRSIAASAPDTELLAIRARAEALDPRLVGSSDWHVMLISSLVARLSELIDLWMDCRALWHLSQHPGAKPQARLRGLSRAGAGSPHRDRALVIWGLAAALLSFLVSACFWAVTGWPQGGSAAMMTLLMALFFGAVDDPRPVLSMLVKTLVFAFVMDSIYLFIVMPSVHSFPTLAIAFAPALIPLGFLAANPATFMIALMPIAMMSFQSTASTDFASYANGMIATILGVVVVLLVTGVVKAVSAQLSARRLVRAGWRDLAATASAGPTFDAAAFSNRMLDRLGLLAPRLAAISGSDDLQTTDMLSDLRLGLCLLELQKRRDTFPPALASRIRRILTGVSRHVGRKLGGREKVPPTSLLHQIDLTLVSIVGGLPFDHRRQTMMALTGIRRALFPDAVAIPNRPTPPATANSDETPRVAAE